MIDFPLRYVLSKLAQSMSGCGTSFARVRLSRHLIEQGIQRNLAGAEDQDDEGGDEEDVGSGGIEFVGVGEEGLQRFAIGGGVGHDHVYGENKCAQRRSKIRTFRKKSGSWPGNSG